MASIGSSQYSARVTFRCKSIHSADFHTLTKGLLRIVSFYTLF